MAETRMLKKKLCAVVFQGDLNLVSRFQVKTMMKCEEEGCVDFEAQRVPDHSVLM